MAELNSILGNSLEKYQNLIHNISDVIAEIDLNGKFTYISPQVHKMFGYKPEDIIGAKFFTFLHPDDMPSIIGTFEKALKSEEFGSVDLRIRHKEGYYINILASGTLVKIDDDLKIVWILKDFTERIKWEQDLKESEEKYKNIYMNSPIAIELYDFKGNILDVNSACLDLFGLRTVLEIEKFNLFQDPFIPEEELKKIKRGEIVRYETRFDFDHVKIQNSYKTSKSGFIYVDALVTPLFQKDTKIVKGYLSQVQDITERKKAEQDLKESEEKYHGLFDTSRDAIAFISLDGRFENVNQAYLKMIGYTLEELRSLSIQSLTPEKWHKFEAEIIENQIKKRGYSDEYEKEGIRKDGTIFPLSIKAWLIKDDQGKPVRMMGIIRDLTEKKTAEQELIESREKYQNLFENSPSSIVLLDLKGKIVDSNIATEILSGYSRKELIGKDFSNIDFCSGAYLSKLIEMFKKLVNGEKVHGLEVQSKKKDGTLIWIMIRASLINIGSQTFIQTIIHDITERKNLEKELNEINQLKSEILERTSHELKTPLISIKGFTDLLLDLHHEKFDTETVSILEEIKQGSEQLEVIINKLLETSYLESGKVQLNPIEDDLSFLIKFCVKNLRGFANTRNIFISLDIPEKLTLKFEKEKLHEVVSHLIINAIKYTPPFGEIKIQSEIKGDFIVVSVEDNGIGITEEEKNKIFKQFGKIEHYGQGWDIGIEGTGMGLYTSKKIVELHGGKIWVESDGRNMGSKFYFSLPLS